MLESCVAGARHAYGHDLSSRNLVDPASLGSVGQSCVGSVPFCLDGQCRGRR